MGVFIEFVRLHSTSESTYLVVLYNNSSSLDLSLFVLSTAFCRTSSQPFISTFGYNQRRHGDQHHCIWQWASSRYRRRRCRWSQCCYRPEKDRSQCRDFRALSIQKRKWCRCFHSTKRGSNSSILGV